MKLKNKALTEKQTKFAHLYVIDGGLKSNTEIAIESGYSKDSAYQRAYELLNEEICPHVVAYIREIQKDIDVKFDVNEKNHLKSLYDIKQKELRGKAKGLYIDYSKNMNINKNEDQSIEELENKMKAMLEKHDRISNAKEVEYDKEKHNKADD